MKCINPVLMIPWSMLKGVMTYQGNNGFPVKSGHKEVQYFVDS